MTEKEKGDLRFMVETLWEDVEGEDGVKTRMIEILTIVKTVRAFFLAFGLIIAAISAYAAWMSYQTAKHTGSLQADSAIQQRAETVQIGEK